MLLTGKAVVDEWWVDLEEGVVVFGRGGRKWEGGSQNSDYPKKYP